jgi:hypothetical protein
MRFRSYLKISQVRHYVTIIVFIIFLFNVLPFVISLVCIFNFVGKTGVPVHGMLTSNAVSLNLKICIYIYAAHKYPERRTI